MLTLASAKPTSRVRERTAYGKGGEITDNVFTFLVKHPSIAGWDPTCYSIALVDPKTAEDEAPVFFDQTGEVKLAPRAKS